MHEPSRSTTHLIIVPSYNTGPLLKKTVREILAEWSPVWVLIDGSDDGSETTLHTLQANHPSALEVIRFAHNRGKGAVIYDGSIRAQQQGYTHILIMDADNQHPASAIQNFMQQSQQHPNAAILGQPVFDSSAPALRVQGRKISNSFAQLETLSWSIADSLFGMRIYPLVALIAVMQETRWARRFDFEPEVAVRLAWRNIPIINIPTPVRYIPSTEGGISHFHYGRDNSLLTWMHIRLLLGFIVRLPKLLLQRLATASKSH